MAGATSGSSASTKGSLVPIAFLNCNNTVAAGFTNIPQNYQDLRLVLSLLPNTSGNIVLDTLNGGIAFTGYNRWFYGNGASGLSSSASYSGFIVLNPTGVGINTTGGMTLIIDFLDYKNTTRNKTIMWKIASDQNGSGVVGMGVAQINSTQAISSFNLSTQNGGVYWVSPSRWTLYGIRSVNQ